MKRTKRLLSLLLAAGLLLTCAPAKAYDPPAEAENILQDGYAETESAYAIYPIPQDIDYSAEGSFTLGTNVSVVSETGIDSHTTRFLDEILADYGRTKTASQTIGTDSQILLGIQESGGAVDTWVKNNITPKNAALFEQTDAYLLSADNGTIVILGKDTDAVYYGLATLQMMFSSFNGTKFLNVQIEDYATIKMRGFIEGFYGGWDHNDRISLMQSARDTKMNLYMYAPKHDALHKNDTLYPDAEIEKFRELVKIGEETKVKFGWSIHLSYFFPSLPSASDPGYEAAYNAKFQKLLEKFQQLYDAGVRDFAVLGDDYEMGTVTFDQIVSLLNRLNEEFIVEKECNSLTYCMQGYNEAWRKAGELESFQNLDPSVNLFWTGRDVNAPITQETVDLVKGVTQRNIVFWLNYPVNEHGKSGVYLGNITHYARDGVTGLTGIMSNPCQYAEINKPALFQLACLSWNNQNYLAQADTIWQESYKYHQPEVYDAYLTIARNVANCPNSGRVPNGFPESEYLAEAIESVGKKIQKGTRISEDENALLLLNEFRHIHSAIQTFRSSCKNEKLIEQLNPWLNSLEDVAAAGAAALNSVFALEQKDADLAWSELAAASLAMDTQGSYPAPNTDVYALAGSKRLVPFINKVIAAAKNQLIPFFNPSSTDFTPSFIGVFGGVEQGHDSNSAKIFDKNETTFASYQIIQQLNDYFGIDMGRVLSVNSIDILQGKEDGHHDIFHNAVLEYSENGDDWTEIESYENDSAPLRITKTDLDLKARYIRLRLTKVGAGNKNDYHTYIREITVNGNKQSDENGSVYASKDLDAAVTRDGLTYRLQADGPITLAPGEYIGIKFKELAGLTSFQQEISGADGLKKQYSANDAVWTDIPSALDGELARYVRLYNDGTQTVSFTLANFTATVDSIEMHPSVTEKTNNLALQEGSWENLFDGNLATFAWTNRAQKNGDYIIVDFGSAAPLYDLTITTEDGKPRFYNAEFYISADKTNWGSPIATVVDSGGDAVREDIYYRIRKNLGGTTARYLKILITADASNGAYLKINEIAVNTTIKTENKTITGNLSGDLKKMVDGNISTVYTAPEPSDGTAYVKYLLTEETGLTSVTLLQNPSELTNAEVKAEIFDGSTIRTETIGRLTDGSTTFYFKGTEHILSLTITWPKDTTPSIYEMITNTKDIIYTLTLDGNGAPSKQIFCAENKVLRLPFDIPAREGYTFKGWTDGTNTYEPGSRYQMGTSDAALTAVWQKHTSGPIDPKPPATNSIDTKTTYTVSGYTYKVTNLALKTVQITGWTSTGKKITVPDDITLADGNKYKVTAIAASAFRNKATTTEASIGKHVTSIGANAFAGCKKLKKITVGSTVLTSIGSKAFYNCKVLKNIVLKSKSLKTVGKNAFKGIHKKAVIKVPSAKLKKYKKLLAKKGQKKTVKIKK